MIVTPHRLVVQFAGTPANRSHSRENLLESYTCRGRVAQLGEHLLCKQGVRGSNPLTSTNHLPAISITYYEASAASFSALGETKKRSGLPGERGLGNTNGLSEPCSFFHSLRTSRANWLNGKG